MGDEPQRPAADTELEREIRSRREYSMAEAIGRLAGSGGLKGASPLAGRREAEAAIAEHVRRNLPDPAGALATAVIRLAVGDEALLRDPHRPMRALAAAVARVLASDEALRELVREADMEWGQLLGERPYFDRPGAMPDPADPYTADSVRAALRRLSEQVPDEG